uniref:Uncharacterized protein n=1 Tax=viral metagenome TaxID=1070528 RepID=A0A6C0D019_9ZZZZ
MSFHISKATFEVSTNNFPEISNGNYKNMNPRPLAALNVITDAAVKKYNAAIVGPIQTTNGDETLYSNKIASFTKVIKTNELGEVNLTDYATLQQAIASGNSVDFANIKLGGARRLTNPQAGLCFDLEGLDPQALISNPPPTFSSDQMADEMIENYWMALCRDVNFNDFGTGQNTDYYTGVPGFTSITQAASADLTNRADFRGPKANGVVTPELLFRAGYSVGDTIGPLISQFLYLPIPFGALSINQMMKTYMPNTDHMTSYANWLNIQNGHVPLENQVFDPELRYVRNPRDMAKWVHMDVLFEAYFNALLIIMNASSAATQNYGIGCPYNPTNPYIVHNSTQDGFATFGQPHVDTLLVEVAQKALKVTWYHKWFVHKRLRPETFGGRIHNNRIGATNYPISNDLNSSTVFEQVFNKFGTYLLPQAYPEGSPVHPSYPAGHATVAAACVTIIKAFYDENFQIPNPVVPAADGLSLVPYTGNTLLTVGNELNKLATNVAFGRNMGGVHYRSDAIESLRIGEEFAISVLTDQKYIYNENFTGWKFTKFDGTIVII